jgi:hypothetical protein
MSVPEASLPSPSAVLGHLGQEGRANKERRKSNEAKMYVIRRDR